MFPCGSPPNQLKTPAAQREVILVPALVKALREHWIASRYKSLSLRFHKDDRLLPLADQFGARRGGSAPPDQDMERWPALACSALTLFPDRRYG